MAGECGTNSLRHTAERARRGPSAVMANPPSYTPVDQVAALKDHFNTLANQGGGPLWLYHEPAHTKVTIEPETVCELAANPRHCWHQASLRVDILYFQQLCRP